MVLIDTHVLIWMMLEPRKLSKRAWDSIRQARAQASVVIADVTLWELAWLIENQRIAVFTPLERFLEEAVAKLVVAPISAEIASVAARLPAGFPKDPIDRLISATAISQGLPLVTADESIRRSPVVSTVW